MDIIGKWKATMQAVTNSMGQPLYRLQGVPRKVMYGHQVHDVDSVWPCVHRVQRVNRAQWWLLLPVYPWT